MATPAAGFNPFSGVGARFKAVKLTVDLGVDLIAAATVSAASTVNVGAFTAFDISKPRESGEIVAANCPADAQGNIYPRKLQGGIVRQKVTIQSIYDGDSAGNIEAKFPIGAYLKFDIIYQPSSLYGSYANCGMVVDVKAGSKISKDPAAFTMEIEYDGLPVAPGYP